MVKPDIDIANLTNDERLRLIEELWDSLRKTPDAVPLTEAQRSELDRRLDEMERDGGGGIPWEEVLERIRQGGR
jgi:putative addiction module component (TIGR02574 family)